MTSPDIVLTVEALLTGRHPEGAFKALMWTKEPSLTHWLGGIQQTTKHGEKKPKVGIFWTPNPVHKPNLATSYEWKRWDLGGAEYAGSDKIAQLASCFSEIDTGTREEQAQRIVDAIAAGMPVPSALVWSGGKSFHLFWLLTEDAMPRHAEWHGVQLAMVRAMGADPSITKYEQRMRYGCGRNNQAGPFNQGPEVRDQRVAHLGEPVALDALVAWAAMVPGGETVARPLGVSAAKNKGVRQDWSTFPHPMGGGGTLRDFADKLVGKKMIPCHLHDDSVASAFAKMGPSGEVFIFCSVCDLTSRDLRIVDMDGVDMIGDTPHLRPPPPRFWPHSRSSKWTPTTVSVGKPATLTWIPSPKSRASRPSTPTSSRLSGWGATRSRATKMPSRSPSVPTPNSGSDSSPATTG